MISQLTSLGIVFSVALAFGIFGYFIFRHEFNDWIKERLRKSKIARQKKVQEILNKAKGTSIQSRVLRRKIFEFILRNK